MSTTVLANRSTRVRSSAGDTNYGTDNELLLGMTGTSNQRDRILLYFDLSECGGVVSSAILRLYNRYFAEYEGVNPLTFGVHMMTTAWTLTGATWNNTVDGYTESLVSGLTIPALTSNSDSGWREFDITAAVNYALRNPNTYKGFILIPNPETNEYEEAERTRKNFYNEREGTGYTPQLIVEAGNTVYICENGSLIQLDVYCDGAFCDVVFG